jgi:cysteine desulfurase/selenocysteine lyase
MTEPSPTAALAGVREREFPWTSARIYFNNASVGPLPERAHAAIARIEAMRREPYRFEDGEFPALLAAGRAAAARLVGADPSEIALAPNTSYGINMAAQVLPLAAGDRVLVPDGEFPANVYPWLLRRRHGVEVRLIPRTAAGWPDEARLLAELDDPRVRAVAVSLVQFSSGYRVDLARLSAACRAHGAFLVVDAIQGLGQLPLDVHRTPVDLLACGAQKWLLSPWGSGFLYVRRALIADLEPRFTGWLSFCGTDDFSHLTDYDPTFHADARRFELASVPYQDVAGMTASLGLLTEVGVDRIAAHLRGLRAPLAARAAAGAFEIVSPLDPAHDSAIWCVRTPAVPAAFGRLREAGVTCALREGSIRLSPHLYNTVDEVERVAALLEAR